MSFFPLLGAAAVTAAVLALGLRHLHDVRSSPSPDLRELLTELRRTAPAERIPLAARATAPLSWEGRLARALCASDDPAERADATSEAVGDLARLYGSRSRWAPAALRIQILGAVLMAAWAMARGDRMPALVIAGFAFAGALATHALGRKVAEHERDQRARADALIMLLMPPAAQQDGTAPGRKANRRNGQLRTGNGRRRA